MQLLFWEWQENGSNNKIGFAHSHFSAIWIIEVVSGETGWQKQGCERKTLVYGREDVQGRANRMCC